MAKRSATKAEREWMGRVAGLGCIVCHNEGLGESPALCHHINCGTMGRKSSNYEVLPLCHAHHDGGKWGIAVHAGLEEWERLYGTERELLEQVKNMLATLPNS